MTGWMLDKFSNRYKHKEKKKKDSVHSPESPTFVARLRLEKIFLLPNPLFLPQGDRIIIE